MKKLTKLSLVAAVAVAGLTTSASAVALEDAIKGVDVSGYVRYRFENVSNGNANAADSTLTNGEETHRYTIVTNVSTPMGDISKANVGFRINGTTNDGGGDASGVAVNLTTANYQLQLGKTTVIAGKQYLNTPLTHNGWDTGTGILALNSDTPVTLAAGYFANTADTTIDVATVEGGTANDGNEDASLAVVAAIGKIAMVDAQAWYFSIQDVAKSFYLEASTNVANVDLKAQYVSTKYDDKSNLGADNIDEHTFFGFEAGTKISNIALGAVYTATGNEGGWVTIDNGQDDAGLICVGEQSTAATQAGDTNVYGLTVMAPVYAGLSLGADYAITDDKAATNVDATEFVARASYKVDKKFSVTAWYSVYDADNTSVDVKQSRVEAKYSF